MSDKNVVKFKKRFHPNLALFLFLIIILYIIFLAWNILSKNHVSIYEVNTSDISDDAPLYGFIMRQEEVVQTEQAGYVNYYCSEGNRIGKGDVAYTIDADGEVSKILEEIQKEKDNSESIVQMREVISSFQSSFTMSNYNDVTKLKYDAKNVVFDRNNGSLYSDLKKAMTSSGKDKNFTKVTAKKSGIVAYTMDGYEKTKKEEISTELFDEYGSITRRQLQSEGPIKAGAPVYKLITSNDWSIVVKLDDSYYQALKDEESVLVTVLKDKTSFNANVDIYEREGEYFAILTTSRFMEHYINDRFLQIEFQLKTASGLKIPNIPILQKDFFTIPKSVVTRGTDGLGVVRQTMNASGKMAHEFTSLSNAMLIDDMYYVSSSVLQEGDILMDSSAGEDYIVSEKKKLSGVYYVNEGYCRFRPVEIQYKNKEYTIVKEQTPYGLAAYDHIVVDPSSLKDDDFIE